MALTGFIRIDRKMVNPDYVADTERLDDGTFVLKMAKGNMIRAEGEDAKRVEREFQQARLQPAVPSWSERVRWSSDAFKIARDLQGLVSMMVAHPQRDATNAIVNRMAKLSEEIGLSADAVEETTKV